jgi:glycosyltransferase involved in cell wall biosynthesis
MTTSRLRVLLVPDSIYWVTGTIAKSIARFNPSVEATIISGPVIDEIFESHPELVSNFDLVHFTCPYASRKWVPRFRDAMAVVTSHHHVSDWDAQKHNLDGDAIVVGSPEWSEDLRERGVDADKIFYVPYGVDAELFAPPSEVQRVAARRRMKITDSELVVGFFGKNSSNEYDRKGIDVFSAAAIKLRERVASLTVLIVGPGWDELAESFSAHGIRCLRIPFVEELSGLAELYHCLDFYWVTARVEGGPVTLLEAMSSGVCCLSTPVGLAKVIVRDGENAFTMPFNDSLAFATQTALFASDSTRKKQIGEAARRTILAAMDVSRTARGIGPVYEAALETFQKRIPSHPAARLSEWKNAKGSAEHQTESEFSDVPLNGLPVSLRKRVAMLEAMAWSEHLILYQQQRADGVRMILKQWAMNPLSLRPPRVLLRRFLPDSFVARIVRSKAALSG